MKTKISPEGDGAGASVEDILEENRHGILAPHGARTQHRESGLHDEHEVGREEQEHDVRGSDGASGCAEGSEEAAFEDAARHGGVRDRAEDLLGGLFGGRDGASAANYVGAGRPDRACKLSQFSHSTSRHLPRQNKIHIRE